MSPAERFVVIAGVSLLVFGVVVVILCVSIVIDTQATRKDNRELLAAISRLLDVQATVLPAAAAAAQVLTRTSDPRVVISTPATSTVRRESCPFVQHTSTSLPETQKTTVQVTDEIPTTIQDLESDENATSSNLTESSEASQQQKVDALEQEITEMRKDMTEMRKDTTEMRKALEKLVKLAIEDKAAANKTTGDLSKKHRGLILTNAPDSSSSRQKRNGGWKLAAQQHVALLFPFMILSLFF